MVGKSKAKKGSNSGGPATSKAQFEQDTSDESDLELPSEDESAQEESAVDEEDEESDGNAPRYAQFMDDSDLEGATDESDDEDEEESASEGDSEDASGSENDEAGLQKQMKSIPYSALVKARAQMNNQDEEGLSDLEPDEFEADRKRLAAVKSGKQANRSLPAEDSLEEKRREVKERLRQLSGAGPSDLNGSSTNNWERRRIDQEERQAHARRELEKRAHKHAPTEMSSKRPVSRRRNVVETSAKQVRDPRFESLSGSENRDLFTKSYAFLPELYKDELSTLKKTLSKLKKQEAAQAGPKARSDQALALREERAKVEIALRRAEGLANERERRMRESEVKSKIKTQNKDRVEKGQLPYYPKKTEVRQMLLRDKYDRLAGTNQDGRQATGAEKKQLKKALERRRKKNASKEKKDMPAGIGFSLGSGGNASVPKRKRDWGGSSTEVKRARV